MPDVILSDYQVLRDGELRLEDGDRRQLTFDMQEGFLFSTALRNHGVMTFKIRPAETGRLTVRAIATGPATLINRARFNKSHTRVYQEAFNLDGIVAQTNDSIGQPIGSLLFEFEGEDGPLILSDIVLHYKKIVTI